MLNKLLKKYDTSENKKQIIKYIGASLLGYTFVFGGLCFLVDFLDVNKSIAFLIIYTLVYVQLYYIQLKFLFKSKHSIRKLTLFCASLLLFYFLANFFFNLGLYFKYNYLTSTLITVIILFPIRFITAKFIVFK